MVGHAGHAGCDRRCKDDEAPVSTVFEAVLSNKELAASIKVEDLVKVLLRHVFLCLESLDARVGDDDVDAAEVRDGLLEERTDFGGFGNVGLDGDRTCAQGEEIRFDFLGGACGFAVVYYDGGTSRAELEGNTCTHTTAGACDEGDLAVKAAMVSEVIVCVAVLHIL